MHNNKLPLSIQLTLPDSFSKNREFHEILQTLNELGFYGIELNIRDPFAVHINEILTLISDHGLFLTAFASGLSAREYGLSLSHCDIAVRDRTIEWCSRIFDLFTGSGAGFIAGFIKGGPSVSPEEALKFLSDSMNKLVPTAADRGVHIFVEATNRYESTAVNNLESAAELLLNHDPSYVSILPDTYHMNIEERDMFKSLMKHAGLYRSLHLSDNNRRFPGFGSIDFKKVFETLRKTGYNGGIAIEGNAGENIIKDIRYSVEYLSSLFQYL